MKVKVKLIYLFILSVCGCVFLECPRQIEILRELRKSRVEIKKYLKKQEELFRVLVDDIKNKRVKIGMLKRDILTTYGEPILSREIQNNPIIKEEFLYRHPTRYFTSDKVYLHFDNSGELVYYEYQRRENSN